MSATVSAPPAIPVSVNSVLQVSVDIYPYEGGMYSFGAQSAYLRNLTTSKDIRSPFGSFQVTLEFGGPTGTGYPTWTQVVTPQSLCVIGATRGATSQIVMVGMVVTVTETQQWQPGQVNRVIVIEGADFGYIFAENNYYNLTALYGSGLQALGGVGIADALSSGLIGGTPAQLAQRWYTTVMAGSPNPQEPAGGVLKNMVFNVNGTKFTFAQIMSTYFEAWNGPAIIPTGTNFIADEGTWLEKFQSFFQGPEWYEFFINTAPVDTYPASSIGTAVPSRTPNYAATNVYVVGRISPQPYLLNAGTAESPKWSTELKIWNSLTQYTLNGLGFLSSSIDFSGESVKNYFFVNALSISSQVGAGNDSVNPFLATNALLYNEASLNRYGYRPIIVETWWGFDPTGVASQTNADTPNAFQALYADMLNRVASYWNPLDLMGTATVSFTMRPDILAGNQFQWTPFRDGVPWTGYIQGIQHSWSFGASATTTLTLTRCLPSAIYADNAFLTNVLLGTVSKVNGQYQQNPGTTALAALTLQTIGTAPASYSTPQAGKPIS
jgi:hypothetical protein